MKKIDKIFKENIKQSTFNINKLYQEFKNKNFEEFPIESFHKELAKIYEDKISKKLLTGLMRFVFLIEPINNNNNSKIIARWMCNTNLYSFKKKDDVRYMSLKDCLMIFQKKINEFFVLSKDQKFKNLIIKSAICNSYAHEINLDYKKKETPNKKIHSLDNIVWLHGKEIDSFYDLRNFINENKTEEFFKILNLARQKKIKIKSYLTDRNLTGEHKTNREKRWEINPNSVQFATKFECHMIEKKLIEQLILFKNFPSEIRSKFISHQTKNTACPITLNEFDFNTFREEIENPDHGTSNFHVGHLNPLKKLSNDPIDGHNHNNISWISDHGNRIQGSLNLKEVRELLKQINNNYRSIDQ